MTGHSAERSPSAGRQAVDMLDAQAVELRAELLRLQNELIEVQGDLDASRAGQLQEANQKLVLAVLQADRIADAAVADLAAVHDTHQRDALTGIPNRALGLDRLANAIVLARRQGKRLAVMFLDLDHFKEVNDNLGHASGDQVLQLVTRRLQSVLRDSDTVSRYGGDEFLVLLPDVSRACDAGIVAGELLAALMVPDTVDGHVLQQSASLGISIYPEDGEDAATLIDHADAAMYRSKRIGKGFFRFHTAPDVDGDHRTPASGRSGSFSPLHDDGPASGV